jgi:hypothetical protein
MIRHSDPKFVWDKEFSPEADTAFERHLRRLKLKVEGAIAHEPMWYTIKPGWIESPTEPLKKLGGGVDLDFGRRSPSVQMELI